MESRYGKSFLIFKSLSLSEPIAKEYRSGFVALIGRPNVGKSTLLNQFIGEKVAITSPVAQTTRNRLRAILTTKTAQLILVDTPGIHKPHHLLGERLVQTAKSSIGEVDVVLLILEANNRPGKGDAFIVNLLKKYEVPVIVVLNKADLLNEENYAVAEKEYSNFLNNPNWSIHRCSAIQGEGCIELIEKISMQLPNGPLLYPPEMVCDQPEKILLAELIREQVLINTREEVPHSVAVNIDRIEDIKRPSKKLGDIGVTAILATIIVERKSQKAILIGKGGRMLRLIGQEARLQMQKLIDGPVYLECFVKVVPDWRRKPARLLELGYGSTE